MNGEENGSPLLYAKAKGSLSKVAPCYRSCYGCFTKRKVLSGTENGSIKYWGGLTWATKLIRLIIRTYE